MTTWLYKMLGDNDQPLYIGVTDKVSTRMSAHASGQAWWPEVRRIVCRPFADRQTAEIHEWHAIDAEQPVHNFRGVMLSYGELAVRLHVSEAQIREWYTAGSLPPPDYEMPHKRSGMVPWWRWATVEGIPVRRRALGRPQASDG